ncbi:MAG: Lrp/AsnC family transcriptional regulator [Candidatus Marsarchaeota archaeon]|nr:Lrp/AsnC family transcriptional regulator [Candidatus Marsarchaeota archaeon]
MDDVPQAVSQTYLKLKEKSDYCITLKKINSKFYVYKATTFWDRKDKKVRSRTEYVGKITESGKFVKRALRQVERREPVYAEQANDIKGRYASNRHELPDSTELTLLTILSTNAKATLSYLGKRIGLKSAETYRRVRLLENKYGIKYVPEIDVGKLGFLKFMIFVKFRRRTPNNDEIRNAAIKEPAIQLTQRLVGRYDLLFYVLARNPVEVNDLRRRLRIALGKYDSYWYTMPAYEHYGFVPLRNEFVETMKDNLLNREYAVLYELNKNGVVDFSEIDRMYGFDQGRSLYTYHKLLDEGVIKRVTVNMSNIPLLYVGLIFEEVINYGKFNKTRVQSVLDVVKDNDACLNKYALICAMEEPQGAVFFLPVVELSDLEKNKEQFYRKKRGISLSTAVVTDTLLGTLCFRKLDPTHTYQYDDLVNNYGITLGPKTNYIETGRKKKEYIAIEKELGVWGIPGRHENSDKGASIWE